MGSCVGIGRKTIQSSNPNGKIFIHEGQLMDRLTEQQVKILKDQFNKHKSSNQGLDRKGMQNLFPLLKSYPSPVISKCFQLFSRDSHTVDFRYFCVIIAKICLSSKEDQADFVFDLFDCDCDNLLKDLEIDSFLKSQDQHLRKLSQNPIENFKMLKEKFAAVPVTRPDFISWSLRNIELSDLLKPFEVIPSGSTEKNKVQKKLMGYQKSLNEEVYLISVEWWTAWKFYVRYQDENNEEYELSLNNLAAIQPANRVRPFALGDRPIEIYNAGLLDDNGRVKKFLKENFDYVVVNKEVWDLLFGWYGGGPVICRKVVQEKNSLIIDLYPLMFVVIPLDESGSTLPEKKTQILISKKGIMKDLLESACKVFEKPRELSRLLYQRNGVWDHLINPESKLLALLTDGCEVLLETAFTDKNVLIWPLERKEKAKVNENSAKDTGPILPPDPKKPEKPAPKPSALIPGISGLANLGNTCYFNSVLQSLLHTPMLEQFFQGDLITSYLNISTKPENSLSVDLNHLAKEMFLSKTSKVVPTKFHKKFVKRFSMFEGNYQHDAHECLSLILNTLHEELTRQGEGFVSDTCTLENPADHKIEIEKADEQWKALQGNKGSFVSDICGGQTRRSLTCEGCGNRKVLFEIFNNLSIPVPASMEICIQVTVVYKNLYAVQFGVIINKFAKVGDLLQEIADLANVGKEKILLCFYYPGSPLFLLKNCENDPIFRRMRDNCNLLVFEVSTTLEEAESLGKKWAPYTTAHTNHLANTHVDVKIGPDWKSGKIKVIEGKNILIELDYEDKLDFFANDDIETFRSHTKFDNPKILHVAIYHQTLRNGKIEVMGFPSLVSIGNWYTFKDMNEIVTELLKRLCCGQVLNEFSLKLIENSTLKCAVCKKCDGCALPADKNDLRSMENLSIAALWEDSGFNQDISIHKSVEEVLQKGKKDPIDITKCLNSFTSEEKVDLECEKCHHKLQKTQVDIWRVPDILIVCLVRFAYQNGSLDKIDQAVYIPFYAFDVSPWVKGVEISGGLTLSTTSLQNAYDLYSVILHSGSIEAGHYTTLVKVRQNDDSMWVCLDDANVMIIKDDPESQHVMQNAYMLFYKRRKLSASNLINLISNSA